MAIQVLPGQVTVSDTNPGGPTATSNIKDPRLLIVKLSGANFTTTNSDALVAVLPADVTIVSFRLWVKTQLAGNGVSAATLALGSASGGAQFMAANAAAFGAAGVATFLTPVIGIFQNYNAPYGADVQIWARGVATTGNPTSGEMYLAIEYVR